MREAREAAGLTQPELAARAGVTPGTIGNIEAGTRRQPRQLLAIADALGVRPEWLQDGVLPMRSGGAAPAAPSLRDALAVVLARLPGLDDYTAGQALNALQAATKPQAPLERIEADLLRMLDAPGGSTAPEPTKPLRAA
jgi:transcriptional regulator with XRE-family HTH domain